MIFKMLITFFGYTKIKFYIPTHECIYKNNG